MIKFGSEVNTASLKDRLFNGLFTTMMITQKSHLIPGAFLLLTISCDCSQRPVGSGQDDWEAILETASVTILGTINDNPVIEVDGTIRENNSKETILGVLLIPDGDSVDDVAEELIENKDPKSPDTEITLAADRHAYYDKTIAVGHTGSASVIAFCDKSALQASKNYNAHLILGEQHVSYSTAAVTFTVPDKTNFQVKLNVANAKRQIVGTDEYIALELKSVVDFMGDLSTGFIFIEQGSTEASATKLIAAIIKQRKTLPTELDFQKFYDREDIIIYPCEPTDSEINIAAAPDTAGLFKRGATYQVYCYVVDDSNNYTISQEDKSITIPRPIAELKIEAASIRALIHAPDIGITTLTLELRGSITKHEGTVAPQVGFLLTTGKPDRDTAARTIKSLIIGGNTLPYLNNTSPTDVIYVADTVSANTTGEQSFSNQEEEYPLDILGQDYNVYFWLHDGSGAVFVSDNSTQLKIPKADVDVISVTSKSEPGNILSLDIETRVRNEKNLSNPNEYFLFLRRGSEEIISQDLLRKALNNSNEDYKDNPPNHIFIKREDFLHSERLQFIDKFIDNSQYDFYCCLLTDSAIFCTSDPRKTVIISPKNQSSLSSIIKLEGDDNTYHVYNDKIEREDNNHNKTLLRKSDNRNLLYRILIRTFLKNGNPDDERIQACLDAMPD